MASGISLFAQLGVLHRRCVHALVSRRHLKVDDPAKATMELGLLVTVVSVHSVLIGGKLADRMSKRKLCIIAAIVAGVGGLFFVAATNFTMTKLPAILFEQVRGFSLSPTGLWLST